MAAVVVAAGAGGGDAAAGAGAAVCHCFIQWTAVGSCQWELRRIGGRMVSC